MLKDTAFCALYIGHKTLCFCSCVGVGVVCTNCTVRCMSTMNILIMAHAPPATNIPSDKISEDYQEMVKSK